MTAYAIRRKDSIAPAFAAAVAAHVLVFLLFAVWLKPPPIMPLGSAVPINIVSSDTVTDSRPAEAAPETQTAAVETPTPEAPPTPTPPPAPAKSVPAPAKPTPAPPAKPTATPVPTRSAPTPKSSFSLDALQASIDKAARSAPARPSSAPRGPTRAETAPVARVAAGTGVSQSQLEGLQQLLGRLWNPCVVVSGDDVKLKATFTVGMEGRVAGGVSVGGAERSPDPTVFAAARRAIDAIHQVEPYAESFRNQRITVNFDAQQVCANH